MPPLCFLCQISVKKQLLVTLLSSLFLFSCASNNQLADMTKASELNAKLGANYLAKGLIKQARKKLLKSLEQNPENAYALGTYAVLLHQLGKDQEAEKNFEKAVTITPDDPQLLNNYGGFLCDNDQPDKAETVFLKAAQDPLYETPEYALTNAGICVLDNQQYLSASTYFSRALQKNPRYMVALYYRAKAYYGMKKYKLAEKDILEYHNHIKMSAESLYLGYKIAQKTGNRRIMYEYAYKLKYHFPDSKETKELKLK